MKRVYEYNARQYDDWDVVKRENLWKQRMSSVISDARQQQHRSHAPTDGVGRPAPHTARLSRRPSQTARVGAHLVSLHQEWLKAGALQALPGHRDTGPHAAGADPNSCIASEMKQIFEQRLAPVRPASPPRALPALLTPKAPKGSLNTFIRRREFQRIEAGNRHVKGRLEDIGSNWVSRYSRDVLLAEEKQRLKYLGVLQGNKGTKGAKGVKGKRFHEMKKGPQPKTARHYNEDAYSPCYHGDDPARQALCKVSTHDLTALLLLRQPSESVKKVVMAMMVLVLPGSLGATHDLHRWWVGLLEWVEELGGSTAFLQNLWNFKLSMVPITNAVRALQIIQDKAVDHRELRTWQPAAWWLLKWIQRVCRSFNPKQSDHSPLHHDSKPEIEALLSKAMVRASALAIEGRVPLSELRNLFLPEENGEAAVVFVLQWLNTNREGWDTTSAPLLIEEAAAMEEAAPVVVAEEAAGEEEAATQEIEAEAQAEVEAASEESMVQLVDLQAALQQLYEMRYEAEQKRRDDAAIKIQAVARGRSLRIMVNEKKLNKTQVIQEPEGPQEAAEAMPEAAEEAAQEESAAADSLEEN